MSESHEIEHVLRALTRGLPHVGAPVERAGMHQLASAALGCTPTPGFALASDAFEDGGEIAPEHTVEGGGRAPDVIWTGAPGDALQLVLIVEDPDAPTPEPFVHWIVYGIPAAAGSIHEAIAQGARVGRSSMMRTKWAPCAPPKGDTAHRYVFQLFALDGVLTVGSHAGRSELLAAMAGRVVGYAQVVGTFEREAE